MKLKLRFLLLMTVICIGFALITWFLSLQLISQINQGWGEKLIDRQVMFDKYRTLSPLIREIELARKMAVDPDIIQMALHENEPLLRQRGIAAMENYRFNFRDHSCFAAMARSGNYYFNDAANQFKGRQLRFVLSPMNANDKWFYATIADGKEYQLNVDHDVNLGVTKVWINVLVRNGREILGVIGTGIDLTDFLKETVGISQHGTHNLFIDKSMAIQLNNDPQLIDYMSIAKDVSQRKKVDALLENPADIEQLRLAMQQLEQFPDQHRTFWVDYEGGKNLLGVAYLPEIGWYDLSLMDTRSLALIENNLWIPFLFGTAFLLALIIVGQALHRWVLRPIAALQLSTDKIQRGDFDIDPPILGSKELDHLSQSFTGMAKFVRDTNRDLENKVSERTQEIREREASLKLLHEELALTFNELESIMETNPDILYVFNMKGELIKWNSSFESFCGLAPEQMMLRSVAEFVCEQDRPTAIKAIKEVFEKGAASIELRFVRHDGELVPYLCNGMVFKNQNGEVIGFTGTGRNIADRHEREEAMRLAATVFNTVDEAVMVSSPDNLIVTVNPAFTAITGYSSDEVIGKNPRMLSAGKQSSEFYQEMWGTLAANDGWQGELCNRRKSGELYVEWLSINVVRDENDKITHHVAVFSDISERKAAEVQLHHMAHYDVLTGLPNRTLFTDRLHQALSKAKRDHAHLALMFLDLDKFKPVNDTLGHNIGDLLLTEVAKRLLDCVRESDTAARIGGDEFVVLLSYIEAEQDAMRVAEKILHALDQPFELAGHSLQISASVGVAIYPEHGSDERSLSKCADIAMYHAKGSGRNNVKLYQSDTQGVSR